MIWTSDRTKSWLPLKKRGRRRAGPHGFRLGRLIFVVARFLALLLVMMWLGGFAWYVKSLTALPLLSKRPTQGIVVLTGGAGRIKVAVGLLEAGLGERLLISGVNRSVTPEELRRALAISPATYMCCIDLGTSALNTEDNAAETAEWARAHHYHSIRVVTAADHMPRSLVEFHRAMPNLDLVPHPIALGLGLEAVSLPKLALEYSKYVASLLRARTAWGAALAPLIYKRAGIYERAGRSMTPFSAGSAPK